jgi:hypothetical protein
MHDFAEQALRKRDYPRACALFAERALANPGDVMARAYRGVALCGARRWKDAADAFERLSHGRDEVALLSLFAMGHCHHELGEGLSALRATAAFLVGSNEKHPLYRDAVRNIATAWSLLGNRKDSASLCRRRKGSWSRARILRNSLRILSANGGGSQLSLQARSGSARRT